ncbi:MAG TPA: hypothetical protein VHS80_07035, partial [Chthoniobacterales bacterium]|nr:hypothetical protein [Chthoniobacterales bacterium]
NQQLVKMKTKVICGQKPLVGVSKTRTRIRSEDGNRSGVVVSPAGRRGGLLLVAFQVLARKIRLK